MALDWYVPKLEELTRRGFTPPTVSFYRYKDRFHSTQRCAKVERSEDFVFTEVAGRTCGRCAKDLSKVSWTLSNWYDLGARLLVREEGYAEARTSLEADDFNPEEMFRTTAQPSWYRYEVGDSDVFTSLVEDLERERMGLRRLLVAKMAQPARRSISRMKVIEALRNELRVDRLRWPDGLDLRDEVFELFDRRALKAFDAGPQLLVALSDVEVGAELLAMAFSKHVGIRQFYLLPEIMWPLVRYNYRDPSVDLAKLGVDVDDIDFEVLDRLLADDTIAFAQAVKVAAAL